MSYQFKQFIIAVLAITFLGSFSTYSYSQLADPDREDYVFGSGMGIPVRKIEKTYPASVKQGYFTVFEGIEDVKLIDDKLQFTTTKDTAVLGWGNYMGKQDIQDVQDTFQECGEVELKVKQSSESSNWSIDFYRDGGRRPIISIREQIKTVSGPYQETLYKITSPTIIGQDWQDILFTTPDTNQLGYQIPGIKFDALGFTIVSKPGSVFQIESIKFIQPIFEGYCRNEFEIPEGKIWRAVANVGSMNYRNWTGRNEMWSTLYINGEKVKRYGSRGLYLTDPVDITPYIKEGKNCVGFYGSRISYAPFLYFQTRIIMESGEVIEFASGPEWKLSFDKEQGWSEPGFDDSSWTQEIEPGYGPWTVPTDGAGNLGIPEYTGRLIIKNPSNKDLFYDGDKPVKVDVIIPLGLEKKSPELSYYFGKSDKNGISTPVKNGSVSEFNKIDGSLVYHINLDVQQDGIYTLALTLKDEDGGIIEERPREPMVVLEKLELKQISGISSTEGLDLELEDHINFTNTEDAHPTKEFPSENGSPTIISDGDLTYREVTDGRRGQGFSYEFEFKHPGDFYLMELEYPDNAQRIIEVVVRSMAQYNARTWSSSEAGVGAETGGRYLPTGKMETLRWIHVADPGMHAIDIVNSLDNEKAAAKSLKIYHVKGYLPALKNGTNRHYGIHSERAFYETGIGKNFGTFDLEDGKPVSRREKSEGASLIQTTLQNLYWLKETGERYVQYLKYTGQNSHIMGCYQYSEYYNPNIFSPAVEDSRVLMCTRTMMANILDINGIDFYAGVEFSQSQDVKTYANNAEMAQGAKSAFMVGANGQQMYGFYYSYLQNWLYPETHDKFCSFMERFGQTYGHLSHFKGVHNFTGIDTRSGGYWMPGMSVGSKYDNPLRISYDDVTMNRFEKETGINTGVTDSDVERFSKRAKFLEDNPDARAKFLSWRSDKFKELISDGVASLRKGSGKDVDMLNVLQMPDYQLFRYLYSSGKPVAELTSELGYDIPKVNSVDGVWTGRWTIGWRHWYPRPPHRNPYTWMARTDPSVISAFERDKNRFVFIRTSWDENTFDKGRVRVLPQPGGYHCREAFIQAIITGDPELLVGGYTDLNINVGYEHTLRGVFQPFTLLPKERFSEVLGTGLITNIAIRQLNQEDESYFYIANPGQWGISGSITIKGKGDIYNLVSGEVVKLKGKKLTFTLEPYGLLAFRSSSPDFSITGYMTNPISEEDYDRLSGAINQFKENIASGEGLESEDKAFLEPFIKGIDEAMEANEYAKAWSLFTEPKVWTLKTDMEKLH